MALKEAQQKVSEGKQLAAVQQQNAEPSRDKIVNEVKQIMNKVFFKIREEFVAGDSYKGSAIISVVLNVIKVNFVMFLNSTYCGFLMYFVNVV